MEGKINKYASVRWKQSSAGEIWIPIRYSLGMERALTGKLRALCWQDLSFMPKERCTQPISFLFLTYNKNHHHRKLPTLQNWCCLDKVPFPWLVRGFPSCEPLEWTTQAALEQRGAEWFSFSAQPQQVNELQSCWALVPRGWHQSCPPPGLRVSLSRDPSRWGARTQHAAWALSAAAATHSFPQTCIPCLTNRADDDNLSFIFLPALYFLWCILEASA